MLPFLFGRIHHNINFVKLIIKINIELINLEINFQSIDLMNQLIYIVEL